MFDVFIYALDFSALANYLAPVLAVIVVLGVISITRKCFR